MVISSMALFTKETAAEAARRSHQPGSARFYVPEPPKPSPQLASAESQTAEGLRAVTTLQQIDKLDVMINEALDKRDTDAFLSLSGAKEKLWKLVKPTAGVNRPSRQSRRNQVEAQPIETAQTPHDPVPEKATIPTRDMSQEM